MRIADGWPTRDLDPALEQRMEPLPALIYTHVSPLSPDGYLVGTSHRPRPQSQKIRGSLRPRGKEPKERRVTYPSNRPQPRLAPRPARRSTPPATDMQSQAQTTDTAGTSHRFATCDLPHGHLASFNRSDRRNALPSPAEHIKRRHPRLNPISKN